MNYSKNEILFSSINPKEFHLIVFPTERCNFRCKYCYEDFLQGKMSPTLISALNSLINSRMKDLDYLTIDWFGGEPLLAYDIIKKTNSNILEFINNYNSHLIFKSSMTTNGYLLSSDVFYEMYNLGNKNYQITLDGPEVIHNTTRILKNSKGTFSKIWDNLLNIKNSDLEVSILLRIHLLESNINYLGNLLDNIEENFGNDKRFNCFLKPIGDLGGCGSVFASKNILKKQEESIIKLKEKYNSLLSFWEPNPVCHASKFNSFIIRSDGSIGKCTTALNDDLNKIGILRNDGKMELNQELINKWSRGIYSMDYDELYCPYGGLRTKINN